MMPQQSDERSAALCVRARLAAGIYTMLLLKDIQVHILFFFFLAFPPNFSLPAEKKRQWRGTGLLGLAERQSSEIFFFFFFLLHCEVLKVTVHS